MPDPETTRQMRTVRPRVLDSEDNLGRDEYEGESWAAARLL